MRGCVPGSVAGPNAHPTSNDGLAVADRLARVVQAVKVKVVRSGVGAITESDVLLASATQAGTASTAVVIIGFNVRPESRAADLAKQESVDIRLHSIIYKVEEEIRAAMIGMLDKIEREKILGKADVREVFRVPRVGAVAGSMVVNGTIRRTARARLVRDAVVTWEGNIASLRRDGCPFAISLDKCVFLSVAIRYGRAPCNQENRNDCNVWQYQNRTINFACLTCLIS